MSEIKNVAALTNIFGHFPSFHDAEIVSILLERSGEGGPSLEAKIQALFKCRDVIVAKVEPYIPNV